MLIVLKGWNLVQLEPMGKQLLLYEGSKKIKGYVEDKAVAFLFELEYQVVVPDNPDIKGFQREVFTVLAGSAIHIPVVADDFITSNRGNLMLIAALFSFNIRLIIYIKRRKN